MKRYTGFRFLAAVALLASSYCAGRLAEVPLREPAALATLTVMVGSFLAVLLFPD